MKLWQAIGAILLVWAAVYLPSLGSQELRGEEARRILPAQEMLKSGDFIVPRIAGEVYASKPPLFNWAIAASFRLLGAEDEFSARLPSAVSVLALGIGTFFLLRLPFGGSPALFVALIPFTSLAMIDKGRIAEIETLYTALFGLAAFLWIRLWIQKAGPWRIWTLPYIPLGLGLLAKGPTLLIFWFLLLLFTSRSSGTELRWKHPSHLLGITLMLAIPLPWTIANSRAVGSAEESVGTWASQLAMRLDPRNLDFAEWFAVPFEILANFLPWTIPLAFALWWARRSGFRFDRNVRLEACARGALLAAGISCLFFCLLPGGLARYAMPAFPLAGFGLVMLFRRMDVEASRRYESFSRRSLMAAVPVLLLASSAIATAAVRESLSIPWVLFLTAIAALSASLWFVARRNPSFFLGSSAVFGAGTFALFAVLGPHWSAREKMPSAAREIAELAKDDDRRLVVFADEAFRYDHSRLLRLFYYLPNDCVAIGESGQLPKAPLLVLGRDGFASKLESKSAEFILSATSDLTIDGTDLDIVRLDPLREENDRPPEEP